MNLAANLAAIRPRLGQATLVAATKSADVATMRALFALGVSDFGENRVEPFRVKRAELADLPIRWHFIGHLQSNKAKDVLPFVDCLHSLDSPHLAAEIQKRRTTPLDCFIEVNVSGEQAKDGIDPTAVLPFVRDLQAFDRVHVVGLMGMAEATSDDARVEASFRLLARLRDDVAALGLAQAPCRFLSMGMSHDFEIAVRCGATHVRLGTILFRNGE